MGYNRGYNRDNSNTMTDRSGIGYGNDKYNSGINNNMNRGNAGLVNNSTTGNYRTGYNTHNRNMVTPADSSVRRSTTSATQPAGTNSAFRNTVRNPMTRTGITRANRFRNTTAETRNTTITFIVLLSAIVALLALAIFALMRRPHHDRISDNDSANRRR